MEADRLVLGFDIGGTQVRVALGNQDRIIAQRATTWPSDLSPADEVRFVSDQALELQRAHPPDQPVQTAGVALAALVDRSGTVVSWPNRPRWRGLAFRSLLAERMSVPMVIEDDANAAALAEYTHSAGHGYRHVLVLMAGTGIGAGLILDGRLFRGRNGWVIEETLHANLRNTDVRRVALHRAELLDDVGLLGALALASQLVESPGE